MKPYTFAILACSASKLDVRAPARDLYTGQLFRLSLQYADLVAEHVLILSAKYGVVTAEAEIEPYDEKLPVEKHRKLSWGAGVASSLAKIIAPGVGISNIEGSERCHQAVLCLAPQSYVSAIGFMYGPRRWTSPLKGLGIGQQKKRLTELLAPVATAKAAHAPDTLASMVLKLDFDHSGDAEAPFEIPADVWARLVDAAKRATGRLA